MSAPGDTPGARVARRRGLEGDVRDAVEELNAVLRRAFENGVPVGLRLTNISGEFVSMAQPLGVERFTPQ